MQRPAVLAVAVLLISACAAPASPPPEQGRVVRVDMSEFTFSPPQIVLNAGETVTLVLTNVGKLDHEFMAGTGAMTGKGYTLDWLAKAKASETGGHDMGHTGEGVRVAPGKAARIVLSIPAEGGRFEFGCFVEGHYEGGMRGVLVVNGAAAPASATPARTETPLPSGTPNPTEDHSDAH